MASDNNPTLEDQDPEQVLIIDQHEAVVVNETSVTTYTSDDDEPEETPLN